MCVTRAWARSCWAAANSAGMGCGASSPANGVLLPGSPIPVLRPPAADEGVSSSPVAAAAGALMFAGAPALTSFGANAGELLLGVSQTIPFIAPVAFLFAAVLKSTGTAVTLKADALAFGRVVESVESLCQEVALGGAFTGEALMASENAVNDLRAALEDGLAHCQKLQNQAFVSGVLFSGRDSQRYSEIQDALVRHCLCLVFLLSP